MSETTVRAEKTVAQEAEELLKRKKREGKEGRKGAGCRELPKVQDHPPSNPR